MTTRRQIWISAGIVGAAAIALAIHTAMDPTGEAVGGMEGHDHAAMAASGGDELRPVRLDAESARRIGITFAEAAHGPLFTVVRAVGVVAYDETRLAEVSPRVEGWVEELFVDFTGAPVRRGEPLLSLYSPALVAAQEELILARRLVDETAGRGGRAEENARALLEAARRRLAYWDVAPDQIEAIERLGEPLRAPVIRAPASGVVVEKNVVQGSRVMPGTTLYRIADLSRVWVEGEVFEKDLALVSVGRKVQVTFAAYPGESFEGTISYVQPTLSTESRTGRIRVELANPDLRLKPGMYGRITFEAPIHLAGLHVPRSAVLTTGTRSIVFVREPDGRLSPREITVGQAAGDHVEVLAGLEEGEVVVASANFLVAAEANLGTALGELIVEGPAGGHEKHGVSGGHDDHGAPVGHENHGAPASPAPHAGH
ncbi:MAG: efflux RND transporter periplasmic adaptor subunit [Gemmatimonadota bacterium]